MQYHNDTNAKYEYDRLTRRGRISESLLVQLLRVTDVPNRNITILIIRFQNSFCPIRNEIQ